MTDTWDGSVRHNDVVALYNYSSRLWLSKVPGNPFFPAALASSVSVYPVYIQRVSGTKGYRIVSSLTGTPLSVKHDQGHFEAHDAAVAAHDAAGPSATWSFLSADDSTVRSKRSTCAVIAFGVPYQIVQYNTDKVLSTSSTDWETYHVFARNSVLPQWWIAVPMSQMFKCRAQVGECAAVRMLSSLQCTDGYCVDAADGHRRVYPTLDACKWECAKPGFVCHHENGVSRCVATTSPEAPPRHRHQQQQQPRQQQQQQPRLFTTLQQCLEQCNQTNYS